MTAQEIERNYEPSLTLFFAGRLPDFNHARHLAVANSLFHLPHGRTLMHLGLQITATRGRTRKIRPRGRRSSLGTTQRRLAGVERVCRD